MTKYEKEIYSIISTSTGHLTAEQLFDQVRIKYPGVVLSTIYNNINRLQEAGLLRKIVIDGSPDRYDRIQKHDHLICKHCGTLTDITFDDLTAVLQKQLGKDFLYYDLKVFYLCPACQKNSAHSPHRNTSQYQCTEPC